MGLIKTIAKITGSTILVTTGTASAILKGASDTIGFELGSELFGAAKNANFNGISSMWSNSDASNKARELGDSAEKATRPKMADTAYRAAQVAKKNGDMERYHRYIKKYNEYK